MCFSMKLDTFSQTLATSAIKRLLKITHDPYTVHQVQYINQWETLFFIDTNLRVTMLKPNSLSEQVVP